MRSTHARRAAALFEQVVDLSSPERSETLEGLERTEPPEVMAELESLLEADAREGPFLDEGEGEPADSWAGPYRLVRRLGAGGMSEVFLGVRQDGELSRRVAVKLVRRELLSETMVRRFEMERQILASLEHPGIATLLDAGRTDAGRPFFVMELLQGEPIDRYCDERRRSIRERVELFCKVCSAVHFAHRNLVVHRDIKPSNVLVTAEGEPKLVDFGIAKLLNPDLMAVGEELTRHGERLLTPEYASPEQLLGKPVSTSSDVYSLGVLLSLLLSGRLPIRGDHRQRSAQGLAEPDSRPLSSTFRSSGDEDPEVDRLDLLAQLRQGTPRSLARELSGDLDAIVAKALRPEADQRYSSAEQVGEDLQRWLRSEPVFARRGGWRYRLGRLIRRQRLAASLLAAICVLIVISAVLFAFQADGLRQERNKARLERDRAQEVTAFLQRLFEQGNPELGGSRDITLRQVLSGAAEELPRELEAQPERRAHLQLTLAKAFLGMGSPQAAVPLAKEALASLRQAHGEEGLAEAEASFLLGRLYRKLGDVGSSREAQERAFRIFRQTLGGETREAVLSQVELGQILTFEGRAEEAVAALGEALGTLRVLPAISPQDLADAVEALGIASISVGSFAQSRALFEEGLSLRREAGARELELSNSRALLAAALTELGDFDRAEALLLENLEIEDRLLGLRQLNRPIRFNNLAALAFKQGDYKKAERYGRQGLNLARDVLPPDHLHLEQLLYGLGSSLRKLERTEEAAELYRELLEVRVERVGREHPQVIADQIRLASALADLGELQEAEARLLEALVVLRRAPGETSRNLRRLLKMLVEIQEAQGRPVAATQYRQEMRALPYDP